MEDLLAQAAVERLGATVRDVRRRQGLTQADLAVRSRVGRSFIIELERGHSRAELGKVFAVLGALGLDIGASAHTPTAGERAVAARVEALSEITESWKHGGPVPDEATRRIVQRYIAGELTIDAAIDLIDELPPMTATESAQELATWRA